MAQFDWDKVRRQTRVAQNGAERSEFTDVTEQIATAKGFSKAHGPWMRACTCCGRYYSEQDYDGHVRLCRPPPKSKKVKCRKCGAEVDPSRIGTHLRYYHPRPNWPNPPKPGTKIKCRHCGRKVAFSGLKQHNKTCPGQ